MNTPAATEAFPPPLPQDADRPLVFLHIPKTAGTSFIQLLTNLFGSDRLVRLHDIDDQTQAVIDRLLSDRPNDLGCLVGHFPLYMLAGCNSPYRLFTVLRHPVERVMSLFRFLRKQPPETQRRLGLQQGFGFDDFIGSRHPELFGQIHDGMTRMLSGDPELSTAHTDLFWRTEPSPRIVETALCNLERFDFGLVEDMDTTIRLARAAWGIPYDLELGHENVTNTASKAPDAAHCLQIIQRNPMDLALYHGAAATVRTRLSALSAAPVTASARAVVYAPPVGQDVAIAGIPGLQGFHNAEECGFAWLSAEHLARLQFDLQAASVRIRLTGYAIVAEYPLHEVEVCVNGTRLVTRLDRMAENWFTIETEPTVLSSARNLLTIRPPYFIPVRHIVPTAQDPRSLSIALAKIAFLH